MVRFMCQDFKKNKESGMVILEGVFGVFVSTIIMMLMLSLGFYLYQQTMFYVVANEIAEDVVHTYKFRSVDDCSTISLSDVNNVGRYRYLLFSSKYCTANEQKGTQLANDRLSKTSLSKAENQPKVSIKKISDDVGRMHYEVTLSQKNSFLMGDILKLLGINKSDEISATVYVESVDISHYINTVKMVNYGINKVVNSGPLMKMIDSVVKIMGSVYKWFV